MSNYKYLIKNISKHNSEVVALELADIKGQPVFNYKPGQYVMIAYFNDNGKLEQRHAFSIASSPAQNNSLILGIKLGGNFTKGLLNLKVGDPVSVAGPYGKFVFNPKKHKDLVMLAGGIGITPFLSAISYASDNNLDNKLSLLYSVRNLENASFLNKIKQLETKNPNLRTLLSVTEEKISDNTPGIINSRINGQVIQDFVGDLSNKTFFLCGPAAFMDAIKNDLLSLGVYKSQIEMEAFSMLDDKKLWPEFKNLSYATGFSAVAVALIFYSIVNASALSKTIKSASDKLNPTGIVNSTNPNVNSQNQTVPSPVTSVSGVPISNPSTNSSPTINNGGTNNPTPSSDNWSTTPQPTTSSSIPVQTQRQTTTQTTPSSRTTATTNNRTVAPAPTTASSVPINQGVINNGGYRGDDSGEIDD
ncbi:MAG: FAD-binding oxidoreductase [Candidatus Falkowbacteria bacterium]|nr:FAD-binding oxidoreductase [Candidatus Falkowbacteria bacterium]